MTRLIYQTELDWTEYNKTGPGPLLDFPRPGRRHRPIYSLCISHLLIPDPVLLLFFLLTQSKTDKKMWQSQNRFKDRAFPHRQFFLDLFLSPNFPSDRTGLDRAKQNQRESTKVPFLVPSF